MLVAVATAQQSGVTYPPPLVRDEGTAIGRITRALDFTGAGVVCTSASGVITCTIAGGGGGGSANAVEGTIDFTALNRLVLGATSNVYVSTWTQRLSTVSEFLAVAWSPELGLFAAVAQGGTNRVSTSPDGITWTPRTAAEAITWNGIAWSPALGLFAAVSTTPGTNLVMTSPDGITWTGRTAALAANWRSVAWSPTLGLFAAVASSTTTGDQVMTSTDGINWTSRVGAPVLVNWRSITWSPSLGIFAAVASNGLVTEQIMTSPDGITWTPRTSPEAALWNGIAWSPELSLFAAVAITGTNQTMTSPDGITWTGRPAAANLNWRMIAWSPALRLFLAVGSSGVRQLMSSPDGKTWTSRDGTDPSNPVDQPWVNVAWSPALNLFVVVGGAAATENQIMTSAILPVRGLVYKATVTGQAWVTATSKILCEPFGTTADGQTIETYAAAALKITAANRVAGVGFDVWVRNERGATGTFRFHCSGA